MPRFHACADLLIYLRKGILFEVGKKSCARCSASVDLESGFYCCSSCQMMGTMDSVDTCEPKIGFCFKDTNSIKHNFETDAALLEAYSIE